MKVKENIREPWSKQLLSTADANGKHLSSVKEVPQECHSKHNISKSALEDTQLTAVGENVSKCKRKKPFNASNYDGHVLTLLKEDIPRSDPEQQRSGTCDLTAATVGRLKVRLRHDYPVTATIPKSDSEPEAVSTNQCRRNSDKQTKDENVSKVGHNIFSPPNQQNISDNSVADSISGAKKMPSNESNILGVNFKAHFPLQTRKRHASHYVPRRQAATTVDSLVDTGASKIKKLSVQNSEDGRQYAKSVCDRSVSIPSEVKLCDIVSSDSDKTLSPPSSKCSVLLKVFPSVLRRSASSESHKKHYKFIRVGRAHDFLDRAGAIKIGPWSNVDPEGIRSVSSGTQPPVPLERVHLYSVSVGGPSRLGT
jgi:hypothetical protein